MTQPTWFTVLLAILPVLSVLAGSFLTAWQNRAANKIALEQSKLQIDADIKKIEIQAEQEEKSRGLDEIIQRRQSGFEAKNLANQRMIKRLEDFADAVTKLHSAANNEQSNQVSGAYAMAVRYAGIAGIAGFGLVYTQFIEHYDDFTLLRTLLVKIEEAIADQSQMDA